jgi:hypothetical protein
MQREKATALADLPHRYDNTIDGVCRVCRADALDARHLAWEKAAAEEPSTTPLPRELGT